MKHPEPALERYCRLVAAADVSVTGLRSVDAIRAELVDDALAARPLIGDALPGRTIDVGSGNGSPGIPLALVYDAPVTLLDAVARKVRFMERVAGELGLAATVVAERSETYARGDGRDRFDLALARALAPPPVAVELCLPLVRPGGRLILWTGRVRPELLEPVCALLSAGIGRTHLAGGRMLLEILKHGPTPDRFPRRPGMAGKRPLASLPSD
ncbi:MAG TPA: RsmG family class I SAM-dependent methyltransferase [Gaiellales bacterium]